MENYDALISLLGDGSGVESSPVKSSKEDILGIILGSLGSAAVGGAVGKSAGNAGLGALTSGLSTYSDAMKDYQKNIALAESNKIKNEKIKQLMQGQNFNQVLNLLKYKDEKTKADQLAKEKGDAAIGSQNLGILQDPSNFEGMTPEEQAQAKAHIMSAAMQQAPDKAMEYQRTFEKDAREDLGVNRIIKDSQEVDPTGKPTQKAIGAQRVLKGIEQHKRNTQPGLDLQERRLILMEERERKKDETTTKKENLKLKNAITKADLVVNKADEALKNVGWWTTGVVGDIRSTLPGRLTGAGAYDLEKTIDTMRAGIGFQELIDMKAASPTGGALGQIAVRELELLGVALGALDKGQSEAQLIKNLKAIKTHYLNWKKTIETGQGEVLPTQTGSPKLKADPLGIRQ
jgi:hypothetical protein